MIVSGAGWSSRLIGHRLSAFVQAYGTNSGPLSFEPVARRHCYTASGRGLNLLGGIDCTLDNVRFYGYFFGDLDFKGGHRPNRLRRCAGHEGGGMASAEHNAYTLPGAQVGYPGTRHPIWSSHGRILMSQSAAHLLPWSTAVWISTAITSTCGRTADTRSRLAGCLGIWSDRLRWIAKVRQEESYFNDCLGGTDV